MNSKVELPQLKNQEQQWHFLFWLPHHPQKHLTNLSDFSLEHSFKTMIFYNPFYLNLVGTAFLIHGKLWWGLNISQYLLYICFNNPGHNYLKRLPFLTNRMVFNIWGAKSSSSVCLRQWKQTWHISQEKETSGI